MKNLNNKKDTTFRINFIFFDDGTVAYNFFLYDLPRKGNNQEINQNKYFPYTFLSAYKGVYRLDYDTIKIQILNKGAALVQSSYYEDWYKIIDKQTMKNIYYRFFSEFSLIEKEIENKYSLATFIPLDTLPSSDSYFKEDKFFWRHESDWEAYMERINKLKSKSNK